MTLASWALARFVALVLVGLRVLPTPTLRQVLLLAASVWFYATWHVPSLALLAIPILVDWLSARRIEASRDPRVRNAWLALSVGADLGLLASFKYAGSLFASAFRPDALAIQPSAILFPVGVSFFTLKSLSYTIDVYRGRMAACPSLWRYALFVAYFPTLLAGPIVRASMFLPQLARSLRPSWRRIAIGSQQVLLGLTKKLVIADQLAPFVNDVFLRPHEFSPLTTASAVIAYSLQIYCDFSGYSDIAIGVSTMLGIDLPENFNLPYLATSLTEFWRRWHVTLSTWLRDYVYIPLGGNRRGRVRTLVNLLVTMVIGGVWHGAGWTFILWGALHGAGLVVHKLWRETAVARLRPLRGVGGWVLTYAFVCVAWVFFRADTLDRAFAVLRKAAGIDQGGIVWLYSPLLMVLPLLVIGHVIGAHAARSLQPDDATRPARATGYVTTLLGYGRLHGAGALQIGVARPGFAAGFVLTLWILLVAAFGAIHTSPFLYLRF